MSSLLFSRKLWLSGRVWLGQLIGIFKIYFETDFLQIVEALRDPTLNFSSIRQIVEDIKSLLHSITEAATVTVLATMQTQLPTDSYGLVSLSEAKLWMEYFSSYSKCSYWLTCRRKCKALEQAMDETMYYNSLMKWNLLSYLFEKKKKHQH